MLKTLALALFLVGCGGGNKQAATTMPAPDPSGGGEATPVESETTPAEGAATESAPMTDAPPPAPASAPPPAPGSAPKKPATRGIPTGDGADPCDGGE